jgi:hypothetical protein
MTRFSQSLQMLNWKMDIWTSYPNNKPALNATFLVVQEVPKHVCLMPETYMPSSISTDLFEKMQSAISCLTLLAKVVFMSRSAKFINPFIHKTLMMPTACASQTHWYQIALWHLLKTDVGTDALITTDLLSQYTLVRSSTGTPNILNLYVRLSRLRDLLQDRYRSRSWACIHDGTTVVQDTLSFQRLCSGTTRYGE